MSSVTCQPKVCVLLAAYNGELYISEQIESILHQTDISVSLFISVDKCTDRTLEICQAYAEKYKNIYVLDYGVRYGSAGNNFFRLLTEVDFNNYDYISLADQDDIWLENKLEHSISFINSNNAQAVSTNVTAFWPNGKNVVINKAQPQTEYDFLFESPGPGCTFVLTKYAAEQLQNFLISVKSSLSKVHWHDWLIYAFCRSRNIPWMISPTPTMLYRQHGLNDTGANSGFKPFLLRAKNVLFGNAIDRAILQAAILEISDMEPIQRLVRANRADYVWMAFHATKLRRRNREKFFTFLAFIFITLKGRTV